MKYTCSFNSKFQMHFKSLPKDDPLSDLNSSTILNESSISIIQSSPKQLSNSHFGKALLIGPLNADRNNYIWKTFWWHTQEANNTKLFVWDKNNKSTKFVNVNRYIIRQQHRMIWGLNPRESRPEIFIS